jgi:hypothetical protein
MKQIYSFIVIQATFLLLASCQDKGSSNSQIVNSLPGILDFESELDEFVGREVSIAPLKKSDGVCSAEELPAGLSINSETCEINGIPTESFFGIVDIELKNGSKTYSSLFTLNISSPALYYKGSSSVPLSSCVPLTISISKDILSDDQISLSQLLTVSVSEEILSNQDFYPNSNCSGSPSSILTFQPGISEATIYFKTGSVAPESGNYSFTFSPNGAFEMDDLLEILDSE